jgi:hypothetical protein
LKPKNIPNAILIVSLIFIFLAISVLGEMVWLPSRDIGLFLHDVLQIGPYQALWVGVFITLIVQGIRVMLGKEKLRAA